MFEHGCDLGNCRFHAGIEISLRLSLASPVTETDSPDGRGDVASNGLCE